MEKKARCRHERNSWIIGGGMYEWCYVCGAFRKLDDSDNVLHPISKWIKPTGNPDKNPYNKLP